MGAFIQKKPGATLDINTDAERHYVLEKSELAGIQDLRHLAETASIEEAWVFVEAHDPSGRLRTLWYEVGEEETPESASLNYGEARNILKDLHARGLRLKSWRNYHHHPMGSHDTLEHQGEKFEVTSAYISARDYLTHQFFSPQTIKTLFEDTPYMDMGVVTHKGVFTARWLSQDIGLEEITSEERQQQLFTKIRKAYSLLVAHETLCKSSFKKLCRDDFLLAYGATLSNNLARVQYFPYPVQSLPPTVAIADSQPSWLEGGWILPVSIGAHSVHMDVGPGRLDDLTGVVGLGIGLAGGLRPKGTADKLGLSLDYSSGTSAPGSPKIPETFHLIDYGLWYQEGYNLESLGFYLRARLGGRNAHFPHGDRNAFWLGADGVVSLFYDAFSVAGGAQLLIGGGYSLKGVLQWDIPSILRALE